MPARALGTIPHLGLAGTFSRLSPMKLLAPPAAGKPAGRHTTNVSERQTHMANTFTKKTAAIALAAGLAFSGSAGAVFAPVAQAQQLSDLKDLSLIHI